MPPVFAMGGVGNFDKLRGGGAFSFSKLLYFYLVLQFGIKSGGPRRGEGAPPHKGILTAAAVADGKGGIIRPQKPSTLVKPA